MNFLERQLKNPKRMALIKRCSYLLLGLIVVAEVVVLLTGQAHAHFGFESIPAFGSLYGLVSCVVIIVVSKLIGKAWLMKREDYYE